MTKPNYTGLIRETCAELIIAKSRAPPQVMCNAVYYLSTQAKTIFASRPLKVPLWLKSLVLVSSGFRDLRYCELCSEACYMSCCAAITCSQRSQKDLFPCDTSCPAEKTIAGHQNMFCIPAALEEFARINQHRMKGRPLSSTVAAFLLPFKLYT